LSIPDNSNGIAIGIDNIGPTGLEVSWAGDCPWRPGYCFGSEDGRIQFTAVDGTETGPYSVAPSEDAINGIAFAGSLMAASTRSEVVFLNVPHLGEGHVERGVYYGGAHGVTSTPSGSIVAPMGRRGILRMRPKQAEAQPVTIMRPVLEALNIYKIACLGSPDHGEILACAARNGGFLAMRLTEVGFLERARGTRLADVDFVDVAALNVDGYPSAAVALGLDCSMHFVRDLLDDRPMQTLRYPGLDGQRAYRTLCAEGHVFLLTNRGLYVFIDLATRILKGMVPVHRRERVPSVSIEAVDVSLAFDRSLLVVTADAVHRIKIDALTGSDRGRFEALQVLPQQNASPVEGPTVLSNSPWELSGDSSWQQPEGVSVPMDLLPPFAAIP
jgi:hypothetical protein